MGRFVPRPYAFAMVAHVLLRRLRRVGVSPFRQAPPSELIGATPAPLVSCEKKLLTSKRASQAKASPLDVRSRRSLWTWAEAEAPSQQNAPSLSGTRAAGGNGTSRPMTTLDVNGVQKVPALTTSSHSRRLAHPAEHSNAAGAMWNDKESAPRMFAAPSSASQMRTPSAAPPTMPDTTSLPTPLVRALQAREHAAERSDYWVHIASDEGTEQVTVRGRSATLRDAIRQLRARSSANDWHRHVNVFADAAGPVSLDTRLASLNGSGFVQLEAWQDPKLDMEGERLPVAEQELFETKAALEASNKDLAKAREALEPHRKLAATKQQEMDEMTALTELLTSESEGFAEDLASANRTLAEERAATEAKQQEIEQLQQELRRTVDDLEKERNARAEIDDLVAGLRCEVLETGKFAASFKEEAAANAATVENAFGEIRALELNVFELEEDVAIAQQAVSEAFNYRGQQQRWLRELAGVPPPAAPPAAAPQDSPASEGEEPDSHEDVQLDGQVRPQLADLLAAGAEALSVLHVEPCDEASLARKGYVQSPVMNLHGYSFLLQVWPSGYMTRSYVSVLFVPVAGPRDEELEWPMPFRPKVEAFADGRLVRETTFEGTAFDEFLAEIQRPTRDAAAGCGSLTFVPHGELADSSRMVFRTTFSS